MPAVFVPLRRDAFERLRALAARERRRVGDQAAVLVEEHLRGLDLPADEPAEPQAESKGVGP